MWSSLKLIYHQVNTCNFDPTKCLYGKIWKIKKEAEVEKKLVKGIIKVNLVNLERISTS